MLDQLMKKLYFLIFLLLTGAAIYLMKNFLLAHAFDVSGEITVTGGISDNDFKRNNMLFIIAKNEKDVPLAVKEIINPVFPLKFRLNKKDIILGDLLTADLKLECVLNRSGNLGKMSPGDIYSSAPVKTLLFSKDVRLVLDSVYR